MIIKRNLQSYAVIEEGEKQNKEANLHDLLVLKYLSNCNLYESRKLKLFERFNFRYFIVE